MCTSSREQDKERESRYEQAMERALMFEHRGDAFTTLEWCIVALRYLPDDAMALRMRDRALDDIRRLKTDGVYSNPSLSAESERELERKVLLALSLLANGARRRARDVIDQARSIDPNHPHVQRAEEMLNACVGAHEEEKRRQALASPTYFLRRVAVAKAMAAAGNNTAAVDVLQRLRDELDGIVEERKIEEIDRLITSYKTHNECQ